MKTRLQDRFTRVDIAAVLVFAAVWIYYIFSIRYGFCTSDESFYVCVAERFALGDRPLIDEWAHPQFSCLFIYLPYRIFVALTGSTAGIILFLRYLFLVFNAVFYWVMYIRLRAYRWETLIATILFSVYIPFTFFSVNYYTAAPRLLMVVCLILFFEKQTRLSLFLAGVLFAGSVILQPGVAALFFGFSALVLMRLFRQKKGKPFLEDYAFFINNRTWLFFSLGVFVCGAVFLSWLFVRSDPRSVFATLPYLFADDPEYDLGGSIFKKIAYAAEIFGPACVIPALAVIALSVAYACGLFRTRRNEVRKLLFCLACAVWIISCIPMFRSSDDSTPDLFFSIYPAPLVWFGFVCFLLCERKNKRLFLFWIVGMSSSLFIDVFSNSSLLSGCPITYITAVTSFTELVRELRDRRSENGTETIFRRNPKRAQTIRFCTRWISRLTCCCFAVWFGFVFMVENTAFPEHYIFGTPLYSLPVVCEDGPWRSLHCSETYGRKYNNRMSDVDTLEKQCPKNLFIYGEAPEMYLRSDLPFAACSPWAQHTDSELTRQIRFWKLHPNRIPDCVYVPFEKNYSSVSANDPTIQNELSDIRETFDPFCEYTTELGNGGFILYVSAWHLESETAIQKTKEAQR